MKKYTALILLLLWCAGLCACAVSSGSEPVEFHYPWANLESAMEQDPDCTAIGSEEREISGNRENLRYLLTIYFRGPLDASLRSPFPAGTAVEEIQTEETTLTLTLTPAFAQLKEMDLTIACTSLARTCFGLTEVQSIVVQTPETEDGSQVSVSISRDSILMEDSTPDTTPTE